MKFSLKFKFKHNKWSKSLQIEHNTMFTNREASTNAQLHHHGVVHERRGFRSVDAFQEIFAVVIHPSVAELVLCKLGSPHSHSDTQVVPSRPL